MSEWRGEITATIEVTKHVREAIHGDGLDFKWNGPEDGIIAISNLLLNEAPDLISRLPWKLEHVGRSPYYGGPENEGLSWQAYRRIPEVAT